MKLCFNPAEAAKNLYINTNTRTLPTKENNPFRGTVSWGLFQFNYNQGQLEGGPRIEYYDKDGVICANECRTLCYT